METECYRYMFSGEFLEIIHQQSMEQYSGNYLIDSNILANHQKIVYHSQQTQYQPFTPY